MGNWLVVPKGTSLARRTRARRAAQYVRMSRELQRYSIANQMAAIAAYAETNALTIVRTYRDEGRSGLRIKGRPGLIELIEDVQSGRADFDHILVYDVSRWGRFQDVDESAYYEFLCKRSGVQVEYCAEIFKNDGTFVSGIKKPEARDGRRVEPGALRQGARRTLPGRESWVPRWRSRRLRPPTLDGRRRRASEGSSVKGAIQGSAVGSRSAAARLGRRGRRHPGNLRSVRQLPKILQRDQSPTE
ncbi:recombinase family protein [Bradyrhizobium sp. 187]|nr:recombinase family protein [Bradyrhizobium sp. 187]